MNLTILGTGVVGRTLAERFVELGHSVTIGTRDPHETLARTGDGDYGPWAQANPQVRLAAYGEAVQDADLVLNATNGLTAVETITSLGLADGTVLLDLANALDFSGGFPPKVLAGDSDSLAERIQRAVPGVRVVKSLNTLTVDLMAHPERLPEPTTVFVSGDDEGAKAVVTALLTELGHQDVLDLGDLSTARGTEQWMSLWLRAMGALGTPYFNLRLVR